MNLIKDQWIPARRADGTLCSIAPFEIGNCENPVVDITAPRPDFRGALYQFLIGLVQTAFAPEDDDEWEEYWNDVPTCDVLKKTFEKYAVAFELINENGPAFMQDFNLPKTAKLNIIQSLMIDSPGENTIKGNKDHFVKRNSIIGLCSSCAATAIFTLQINASAGGAGNRTGLRGGGPLTTLVIPFNNEETLWGKIWCNIISVEERFTALDIPVKEIFPWMGETYDSTPPEETKTQIAARRKLSSKEQSRLKTERELAKLVFPHMVNELQVFWGMPRRIRLISNQIDGICSCCGEKHELFINIKTKNYGCNYSNTWRHTLSPYSIKKEGDNIIAMDSFKGKEGGYCYTDWLALVVGTSENTIAAQVVKSFNEQKYFRCEINNASIWCFGYELDKDKTRCWYNHTMPLIILPHDKRSDYIEAIQKIINASEETSKILREQVKSAWFERPKDSKGDTSFIMTSFYEETETVFFTMAQSLRAAINAGKETTLILAEWRNIILNTAELLFDRFALQNTDEIKNMKRIAEASKALSGILRSPKTKPIQALIK